jgi:hypothetical protein
MLTSSEQALFTKLQAASQQNTRREAALSRIEAADATGAMINVHDLDVAFEGESIQSRMQRKKQLANEGRLRPF